MKIGERLAKYRPQPHKQILDRYAGLYFEIGTVIEKGATSVDKKAEIHRFKDRVQINAEFFEVRLSAFSIGQ